MRKLKTAIHSVLLMAMPSSLLYPQEPVLDKQRIIKVQEKFNFSNLFYDDVLKLLEDLESGELERSLNEDDLQRINQFLAYLARQGIPLGNTEEVLALERDIAALMEESSFDYHYAVKKLDSVSIFLTREEAVQLRGYLNQLLDNSKLQHFHLSSSDYKKDVTICLYDEQDLKDFDQRSIKLLKEDI